MLIYRDIIDSDINSLKITCEKKIGYIYVIYNKMFDSYGEDVYKVGETKNIEKRKNGYRTGYVDKVVVKYQSREFINCKKAEELLFVLLRESRIVKNREFFKKELSEIIKNIEYIERLKDKEIEYLSRHIRSVMFPENLLKNYLIKVGIIEYEEVPLEYVNYDLDKYIFKPKIPGFYRFYVDKEKLKNDMLDNIIENI
jgi:hypothetical protein